MQNEQEHINVDVDFNPIINGMIIITIGSGILLMLKFALDLNYSWLVAFSPIIMGWFHIVGLVCFKIVQAIAQKHLDDMFGGDDEDFPPPTGSV
jgi:hypothetical protein